MNSLVEPLCLIKPLGVKGNIFRKKHCRGICAKISILFLKIYHFRRKRCVYLRKTIRAMALKVKDKKEMSRRDAFRKRFAEMHPDVNADDEEAFYGGLMDDYDKSAADLGRYKENDEKLTELFASDPRSATFLTAWADGKDPTVEFVRRFGGELKEALDDPEKLDALAEADREYTARVAKNRQLEAEYDKNIEASKAAIAKVQEEDGVSDEEMDAAIEKLAGRGGIFENLIMGRISEETVRLMLKAVNYDGAVEDAARNGEVRGRNTQIVEKLKKRQEADGVPSLGGGKAEDRGPSRYGVLDQPRRDIWAGMKRTSYK